MFHDLLYISSYDIIVSTYLNISQGVSMLSKIGQFLLNIMTIKSSMYQSELELYLASKKPVDAVQVEYLISSFNRRRQYGAC